MVKGLGLLLSVDISLVFFWGGGQLVLFWCKLLRLLCCFGVRSQEPWSCIVVGKDLALSWLLWVLVLLCCWLVRVLSLVAWWCSG